MYKLNLDYSKQLHKVLNKLLLEVASSFFEIGSNLSYEEIYATVFPPHLQIQESEENILNHIKRILSNILDDYMHELTSLDEYIIFGILHFMYEATKDDGTFLLNDLATKYLSSVSRLPDAESESLLRIVTISDLIDICFEDVDFLDVGLYFDWFKNNPEILKHLVYVDLDYYQDIMPPDILKEYLEIKSLRENNPLTPACNPTNPVTINEFKKITMQCLEAFDFAIKYRGLHQILNSTARGKASEKEVQVLFQAILEPILSPHNILSLREVDTCRGCVDFYLSLGTNLRSLIEIKLSTNANQENGLLYQLPTYMISEKIDFGVYLLICYDEKSYLESASYINLAEEISKKYNKDIRFYRIHVAPKYLSASKIKDYSSI